jgi:hypothetical protein
MEVPLLAPSESKSIIMSYEHLHREPNSVSYNYLTAGGKISLTLARSIKCRRVLSLVKSPATPCRAYAEGVKQALNFLCVPRLSERHDTGRLFKDMSMAIIA